MVQEDTSPTGSRSVRRHVRVNANFQGSGDADVGSSGPEILPAAPRALGLLQDQRSPSQPDSSSSVQRHSTQEPVWYIKAAERSARLNQGVFSTGFTDRPLELGTAPATCVFSHIFLKDRPRKPDGELMNLNAREWIIYANQKQREWVHCFNPNLRALHRYIPNRSLIDHFQPTLPEPYDGQLWRSVVLYPDVRPFSFFWAEIEDAESVATHMGRYMKYAEVSTDPRLRIPASPQWTSGDLSPYYGLLLGAALHELTQQEQLRRKRQGSAVEWDENVETCVRQMFLSDMSHEARWLHGRYEKLLCPPLKYVLRQVQEKQTFVNDLIALLRDCKEPVNSFLGKHVDYVMECPEGGGLSRHIGTCVHGQTKGRNGTVFQLDAVFNFVPCGFAAHVNKETRLCLCETLKFMSQWLTLDTGDPRRELYFMNSGGYEAIPKTRCMFFWVIGVTVGVALTVSGLGIAALVTNPDKSVWDSAWEGTRAVVLTFASTLAFLTAFVEMIVKPFHVDLTLSDLFRGRRKVERLSQSELDIMNILAICTMKGGAEASTVFKDGFTCLLTNTTHGSVQQDVKTDQSHAYFTGTVVTTGGATSVLNNISGAKVRRGYGGTYHVNWNESTGEIFYGWLVEGPIG